MKQLPIKSTERDINNGPAKKDEPGINIANKGHSTILRIVILIVGIIVGTAICTTVIYFVFLKKDDKNNEDETNNNTINNSGKLNKANKQTGSSIPCETGTEEFCKTCDVENNICSACNPGYYLPLDSDDKTKCKKCTDIITNCNECHGNLNSVTCDNFVGQNTQSTCNLNIEEKREYCRDVCEGKDENICNEDLGYEMVDGECKLMYSYRAIIKTTKPYEKINLIYSFRTYVKRVKVDGVIIEKPSFAYNFTNPGLHIVFVLVDIPSKVDYSNTFFGLQNMISIHFTPLFNTSSAERMISFFSSCYNLTSINLSVFDTRNVESMSSMFSRCEKLTSLDVSNFNTLKVTDMSDMFSRCYALTSIDISNFKAPKLSLASGMFGHCYSLTSIDISHLESKKLANIENMFSYDKNLKYVNVRNVNTSRVTQMSYLFQNCTSLSSIDLSGFDTTLVRYMTRFFQNCISLTSIDIGHFRTDNAYGIESLFTGCTSLTYINMAKSTYGYSSDIFQLVPDGGTIIVHPTRVSNAEKYLSKKGWNIISATENN